MAAIDLGDVTNVPYLYTKASVGTTWQEFKLPPWCCRVTVVASKAAWGSVTGSDGLDLCKLLFCRVSSRNCDGDNHP